MNIYITWPCIATRHADAGRVRRSLLLAVNRLDFKDLGLKATGELTRIAVNILIIAQCLRQLPRQKSSTWYQHVMDAAPLLHYQVFSKAAMS